MNRKYRDAAKIEKVINSCTTFDQLNVAKKLVELWGRVYPPASYFSPWYLPPTIMPSTSLPAYKISLKRRLL